MPMSPSVNLPTGMTLVFDMLHLRPKISQKLLSIFTAVRRLLSEFSRKMIQSSTNMEALSSNFAFCKMLLIKQIIYNDEVKIGVIDIKEVDTKKEAHHIVQSFIANFSAHRKDLQDVLQCSMSRRMPKRSPMLLLLPKMRKIFWIQLNVL